MRVLIRLTAPTVVLSEFLGQHPIKDVCITPFQHEMRAAPAGRRQAQPGVATGHNVLAWQLGYVEVFIKKWYINWRLGKLSLCLIRTNSSLECKRRITAGSCPGNELVWTD